MPPGAVALARYLAGHQGPILFGADANTPEIDAHDFADTRTHWHTGRRHLRGEPGDDLLFGLPKSTCSTMRCAAGSPSTQIMPQRSSSPRPSDRLTGSQRAFAELALRFNHLAEFTIIEVAASPPLPAIPAASQAWGT